MKLLTFKYVLYSSTSHITFFHCTIKSCLKVGTQRRISWAAKQTFYFVWNRQ